MAIATVIVFWAPVEILGRMNLLSEIWVDPLGHKTEMGLSGNFWLVSFKISYLCLPLFHETRTTPSCHPSGCAYRQL